MNEPLELHNSISQKNSNESYFHIGSCCLHASYKPISYWLHDMAAACYFAADLGNQFDHNFPSRLTDGTPHSSSDLIYFTPFLPFNLLDKIILSPSLIPSSLGAKIFYVKIPSSLCSFQTKNSKSNSKFAKKFQVNLPL